MNRISAVFSQPNHKALIAYITVGYPSPEATLEVVPLLAESGCDLIELGIPFSDPLADGITIQNASYHALLNGVTPKACLEVVKKLRQKVDIPLVFMGYFNPIFSYSPDEFCAECRTVGLDGLIVPDLPPDEGAEMESAASGSGLDLIYLLAPSSTDERVKLVAEKSQGFIYIVSVTGVTGVRNELPVELGYFVKRVRKATDKPLCVGFGISSPQQASQVAEIADGIIVGSRIIQLMESDKGDYSAVREFVSSLRAAISSPLTYS